MRLRTPSPPPDLARPVADAPASASEARRARQRAGWRQQARTIGIVIAIAAVIAGAAWVVGYSTLLSADDVEVTGVEPTLADTVRSAAQVPLGSPLARVDTDAVAGRVSSVPEVAAVTVTRSWPGTIVVAVEPRTAVAALASPDGWRLADAEGVLFSEVSDAPEGLPLLVAPDGDGGADARRAGVSVAAALPPSVVVLVERIEAPSPVDVRLVLTDGRLVAWGSEDQSERKAQVLTVLLDTPATQYDVSVPDRPTLRPVPEG